MSPDDNEFSPNDDNDQGHFQARFWYNNETDYRMSLRGVLFTDTGPYRGAMRQCYHRLFYFMKFISVDNDGDIADEQGVRLEEEKVQRLLCQLRLPRPDCPDGEEADQFLPILNETR